MNEYLKKIANYYENNDSEFLTKKMMYCVDECLNLLDYSLIHLSIEEINDYRHKAHLILEKERPVNELNNLNVEISKNMKGYLEMNEKEKMAYRAFLSLFEYPSEDDWGKYQTLEFTINFLIKSGVNEIPLKVIVIGFFRDIITNWTCIEEED
jgi:hypothetical protein